LPSWAFADGAWYQKDLQRVTRKNSCQLIAYGSGREAMYLLITPEYLVSWCKRKSIEKPGKLSCVDPTRRADTEKRKEQAGIVACRREDDDVSPKPAIYDLIVLTSQKDHEWRACPKFINLGVLSTHPVWVEKNTKPYGDTFSLSQFWVAEEIFKEKEFLTSQSPASGHALLYGDFGAGQILYCYRNQWVMSGYH
jgi:hypothetical protein